eukprot:4834035-Alexandrium_andersonii.AAC.1
MQVQCVSAPTGRVRVCRGWGVNSSLERCRHFCTARRVRMCGVVNCFANSPTEAGEVSIRPRC